MKKKGIALITTLGAVAFAAFLLAAFVQANLGFFAMSRTSEDKVACQNAVRSMADYVRFRLEEEQAWGFIPAEWDVPELSEKPNLSKVYETFDKFNVAPPNGHGLVGFRHVLAKTTDSHVELHVAFSNNLNLNNKKEFQIQGGSNDEVAGKSCVVRISARRGTATDKVEVTLRKAAFFDSTLASSGDIKIHVTDYGYGTDLEKVIFESEDPIRNQIRSERDIKLPPNENLAFRPEESNPAAIRGTVWSKGDIKVGDGEGDNRLIKTAEAHQIELIKNARNHYNVPKLTADDIALGPDGVTHQQSVNLRPQIYSFDVIPVTYEPKPGHPAPNSASR